MARSARVILQPHDEHHVKTLGVEVQIGFLGVLSGKGALGLLGANGA